ncbi:FHA domain-containing protein [Wenzhouxiangella sp. AB-CW3]|uniref:FHA domain-containing protein n=1 Tax=Wenzhouxiangella sp. AB-CW3 TaxID=2771012 RepID=UPI00168B0DC4|nr:FHA domain-containing protein [Wenzhouxiangella sp. AB-CW3]QOC21673.1 FHA domain-containing protein [Wenzhouxiangella sp. AB-CW3]
MTFRLKAASGPHTGQTFDLDESDTAIGSADGANIAIDGLLEQHARITFDGEVLMLEADDQAWVNGEPVSRQPLKSGDEIRLGEHRFVLQAPGLRPPSVLREVEQRHTINPWTWVAIGAVAAGGIIAVATFILTRL